MLPTGLCLLGLLLLGALLGPQLALFPPGYHDNLIYLDTDQGRELFVSPVAPQKPHYLGTDPWGYDMLSLMLHGLQYSLVTVVVVAMLRVLLALAVVGAGAGGLHTSRIWGGLNAIPQFVIIYFILYNINFNSQLGTWELSAIQWILLILFGIPALVPSVAASLEELERREFVTVARATGAGPARRFFVHILPHLWERLLLLFSRETTAVLTLVGQLGIFNIFIGGTIFTPHPTLYHSKTHEWAGLLGQYRGRIHGDAWWVAVFPLLGFMLLLLGCYLTSRGLQRKLQDTYHSVSHL
jgi:peptide/nickel transport system permease protein